MARVLGVRLDSMGDVLVTGSAMRALAADADHVTMLVGPLGSDAARLLPGVDDVIEWDCPWIAVDPPTVDRAGLPELVERIRSARIDAAVVFTSYHQSALPTALLLREAGVGYIGAFSDDYPGSLLDVRHRVRGIPPEPERAVGLAAACGFRLPSGDDGRLRVRIPTAMPRELASLTTGRPYVVVHPGASAESRRWPTQRFRDAVAALTGDGWRVLVTGTSGEADLCHVVAGRHGVSIAGRLDLAALGCVLRSAAALISGNTGPAHLAAAVGTPVVSLFSPVVPAEAWAPYGVAVRVLGYQDAACRGSRARECPVAGHPCLTSVLPGDVVLAVRELRQEAA